MRTFLAIAALAALVGCTTADPKPLFDAIELGDVEQVKAQLDKGVDVNAHNADKEAALHHAAMKGNVEICKLLLSRGAERTTRNSPNG